MAARRPSLRTLIVAAVLVVVAQAAGGFLFAWSGLYSVAASRDHWPITRKFLEFGLRNSIETHSLGITAPNLDDPDLVRLGAGHFAGACATCHGAPGEPALPTLRRMLPSPPPLHEAVKHWEDPQLFWIVQNGLKYTGMPAFIQPRRTDEVWAVVAYLRRLPDVDAERNRELADLRRAAAPEVPSSCVGCHGAAQSPPISRLVPKLEGLSASYIEFSLRSYRRGARPSGMMQQFAGPLDDATIGRVAAYYAALPRTVTASVVAVAAADIERGRAIAERGLPAEGIPPCLICHEARAREIFPRLPGQHARYIVNQLELWQKGLRQDTALGQIMAPIARRLTPEQMRSVAAFLETRAPAAPP